ncbi:MAG TPA: Asp-tRNA(Asn)/Glu-tRNA(Gln) amidotransferase subunit GatC [Steroidobacteraceae bacterium]|nr:Asp-tRNA(Asn)/Glu-tRNA(Gln) amidotransferase subunit GatC [Steroidobacteraceae bacterium]
MSLSRRDIDNIAQLARLALSESEVPAYIDSLSRIIALVGELEHADTRAVAPMSHPLAGLVQRQRADVVSEGDRHELYQRNAPQALAGLYLVPKVLE